MPDFFCQRVLRSCAFIGLLLLSFQGAAQGINTSSIYRNDDVGVRAAFAPSWNIITNREQAPDVLKPNFPADKGPNDSPLFIGVHDSQQLFIRLLTETYFDDLEAYAGVLAQSIASQGLEITAARLARDNTALEMDYRHPQLGLHFRERVALLADSQVIRMAAWATEAAWPGYNAEVETAFAGIELSDAVNVGPGWQPVWEDLESRLAESDLAGIPLAQAEAVTVPAGQCSDPTSSMLWRVTGPALDAKGIELYLFGSIHVGKPDFYPLPPTVERVFRNADHLVFEVDPTTVADPAVIMSMQSRGMLPQGKTLNDVVSPEVVGEFERLMGSLGLPAENFMGMQPWFVTLMLSGLQMNALGYLPEYGLESYFLSRKPAGADILELESIQQQIGFLQALNAESYLAYTIKSFETGKEEIEKLIAAWKCADKGPLEDMLFDDFVSDELGPAEQADMDALMDALYTRRNVGMADKIADFVDGQAGRYFVVVGSAHLLGEGSVVAHLRDAGFTVAPVPLDP